MLIKLQFLVPSESVTTCHDAQVVELNLGSNPVRFAILTEKSENYAIAPQYLLLLDNYLTTNTHINCIIDNLFSFFNLYEKLRIEHLYSICRLQTWLFFFPYCSSYTVA